MVYTLSNPHYFPIQPGGVGDAIDRCIKAIIEGYTPGPTAFKMHYSVIAYCTHGRKLYRNGACDINIRKLKQSFDTSWLISRMIIY